MNDKFERFLKLISDTENITPDDELSNYIDNSNDGELSEDDLEFVSAATKSDYEKFMKKIKNK